MVYLPPTWIMGRRLGSGSTSLKISWVTGAVRALHNATFTRLRISLLRVKP